MIYVTGDTHGSIDTKKLNTKHFPDQRNLTKEDYLIICGDTALVWKPGSKEEKWWQNWFEERNYTTLFIDGNHENHCALQSYPVEMWNGGKVHKIKPSVIHLMRGQVYHIDGCDIFTMGGATSTDRIYRKEEVSWWKEEMPSEEEYQEALSNLDKVNWKVDYVITHTAPDNVMHKIDPSYEHDRLTNFLFTLDKDLKFKHWYFGHFHDDRIVDEKHTLSYQNVTRIDEDEVIIQQFQNF